MTQTTEQERALADLRHLYAQMVGGLVKDSAQAKRIADGILSRAIQKLEQAARRAPAVPVPQGWKLVPEKSTEAMARAFRADDAPGYFCMTTLRCADFAERYAAMLAAAPQPPEADHIPDAGKMVAAPMQIPENIREGEPYDNPAFEALARALGVWGTAQSAVCAQFWIAAKEQST